MLLRENFHFAAGAEREAQLQGQARDQVQLGHKGTRLGKEAKSVDKFVADKHGRRHADLFVINLLGISRVKTQEYNKGVSFRIPTIGFTGLCRAVESVPGVAFTQKRKFFWSGEDVGTEFTFRGHSFAVDTDGWDGALWIVTKDGQPHPDEMQVLRDAVERSAAERGLLGSLWRRFITETFT